VQLLPVEAHLAHPLVEFRQAPPHDLAHLVARAFAFTRVFDDSPDLVEREPQCLRPLDEGQPREYLFAVDAVAAERARGTV
jgi:hypothetical protein